MKRCPECDSADTLEILFAAGNGFVAIPKAQRKKVFPKESRVEGWACAKCGRIFDLRLCDPERFMPFAGYDGSNT